tara:strand:- start:898 stop:1074 length:177 start_codon:yes stop_codon:yes gene_type:complete
MKEIISKLSKEEQKILQNVMTTEQSYLYIKDLQHNRTKEKEAIQNIVNIIEREIRHED